MGLTGYPQTGVSVYLNAFYRKIVHCMLAHTSQPTIIVPLCKLIPGLVGPGMILCMQTLIFSFTDTAAGYFYAACEPLRRNCNCFSAVTSAFPYDAAMNSFLRRLKCRKITEALPVQICPFAFGKVLFCQAAAGRGIAFP